MPLKDILQPQILPISDTLRLRRYSGDCDFALSWYQDPKLVYLVDGVRTLCGRAKALGYWEIYSWNKASRHCFESVGFFSYKQTENGFRYKKIL